VLPIEFAVSGAERSGQVVLRMETLEPAIYPAQAPGLDVEVELQFRTMAALGKTGAVPVAKLLGYEPDPKVLGAPFFVMDFVAGEVPRENPIYTSEGFYFDAAPEQRRGMLEDGLQVLAKIHSLDWREAGFGWLEAPGRAPGMATQLAIWEEFTVRELAGRDHPSLDRAWAWLHANLPPDSGIGLCWGDARPGNIIWQDFRCACVTDFENVSLGPPELDLGWWLMFDRWSHETYDMPRLAGEPTREEQRDHYVACLGREITDSYYYELFAAVRYAAIVVRVMNRMVERGTLDADQMLWLRNPAATCLDDLLGEI
jgi:aminoglycoside phosphotransferase (APT) family kinase protein